MSGDVRRRAVNARPHAAQLAAAALLRNGNLSSYSDAMPRRKAGVLLPLELAILEHGIAADSFYGFALARSLADGGSALTAHGTLYKALPA